jgi:hypothetical protein
MRHELRSILALCAAAVLLAGCADDGQSETDQGPAGGSAESASLGQASPSQGGSDTDPDAAVARALDVCAMVDDATVEQVLAEPAEATDQSTGDLYGCSWEGTGDALNVLAVSIYVHPDAATAAEQYELTMSGLEGSDITGLGQAASYNESFGLEVLHDRYDISVDNTGPDEKMSDIMVAKLLTEALSG